MTENSSALPSWVSEQPGKFMAEQNALARHELWHKNYIYIYIHTPTHIYMHTPTRSEPITNDSQLCKMVWNSAGNSFAVQPRNRLSENLSAGCALILSGSREEQNCQLQRSFPAFMNALFPTTEQQNCWWLSNPLFGGGESFWDLRHFCFFF